MRTASFLVAFMVAGAIAARGQQKFASPEQASDALVEAAKSSDPNAVFALFGPEGRDLGFG